MIHLNLKTVPIEMLNHKSNNEPQQLKLRHNRAMKTFVEISSFAKVTSHY